LRIGEAALREDVMVMTTLEAATPVENQCGGDRIDNEGRPSARSCGIEARRAGR
jgi:hypothetical protein